MLVRRTLILAALLALIAAGCSDDDTATEDTTADDGGDTEETVDTSSDPGDGEDPGAEGDEDSGSGDSAGGSATATVSDGSSWEFTEVVECEIGEEGSPDYREFIGRTADGSAQLNVSYFPEAELASLSGVGIDAEVDGNDWTYADSYTGSDAAFDISLQSDGAEGTAPARVVGIGAPDEDLTIDWSFTC